MSKTVISVEHLTKRYQLGVINTGTLQRDFNRWWARTRGKPDPYAKIGQSDHGNRQGESILALDDVSFTVQQGEVLGIIGKNGAGKSTLLKILSQVTAPTSGRVGIKGRVGSLLEVGTGFHPELTGRENVYLNGAILGMTRAEVDRKYDEIVDFSGVEQFIDTPVKRYSSGMYVRLAFAVAAHLDPEILVVDEVLAVGDAEFQKKCLGKMSDVAGEGRTVLFVSHNMGAIHQLCQFGILLDKGSITYYGSANSAVSNYIKGFRDSGKKLIERQTERNNFLEVEEVLANNNDNDQVKLEPNNTKLTLEITFRTMTDVKLSINAYLFDAFGTILGIYSPGHMNRELNVYPLNAGTHTLIGNLAFPKLTSGDYYLSFGLADPGYLGYAFFDYGLKITVLGNPTKSGHVFKQGEDGYIIIEGETERRSS